MTVVSPADMQRSSVQDGDMPLHAVMMQEGQRTQAPANRSPASSPLGSPLAGGASRKTAHPRSPSPEQRERASSPKNLALGTVTRPVTISFEGASSPTLAVSPIASSPLRQSSLKSPLAATRPGQASPEGSPLAASKPATAPPQLRMRPADAEAPAPKPATAASPTKAPPPRSPTKKPGSAYSKPSTPGGLLGSAHALRGGRSRLRQAEEEDEVLKRLEVMQRHIHDGDGPDFEEAIDALLDMWDASAGSDSACVTMAETAGTLPFLVALLEHTSNSNFVREAAANVLVNVSCLPAGATAVLGTPGSLRGLTGVLQQIHSPQPSDPHWASQHCTDIELLGAGAAALKALANLILAGGGAGQQAVLEADGCVHTFQVITACPHSHAVKEMGAVLLGAYSTFDDGEQLLLRMQAPKLLVALLVEEGMRVKEFGATVDDLSLPMRYTEVQVKALSTLRSLSRLPQTRIQLQQDAVPGVPSVRIVAAHLKSDHPLAVEDAAAILCNVSLTTAGQEVCKASGVAPILMPILHVSVYMLGWRAQVYVAGIIANFAVSDAGRLMLLRLGALKPLVGLLAAKELECREAACLALRNLTLSEPTRILLNEDTVAQEIAVRICLKEDSLIMKVAGAALTRNLTVSDSGTTLLDNEEAMKGLIAQVIRSPAPPVSRPPTPPALLPEHAIGRCLLVPDEDTLAHTLLAHLLGTLRNLTALQPEGVWRVLYLGRKSLVRKAVHSVACGHPSVSVEAAGLLGNLCCVEEGKKAVEQLGGYEPLVGALVPEINPELHNAAVYALRKLLGVSDANELVQVVLQNRGIVKEALKMKGKRVKGPDGPREGFDVSLECLQLD